MLVATAQNQTLSQMLKDSNLTIQDLARRADVSYATAWGIVTSNKFTANTRISTIQKFAEVLRRPVSDLLPFVED